MNPELVPVVGPSVSLLGAVVTPFIVKFVNRAMTKSDRWEDYRCCEEFIQKLTPDTHPLVIEKWYEAVSNGDRADANEILYMVDLGFSSEEISLRKRAKDFVSFAKPGTGNAVGHQFKDLMRFSWVRGAYSFGNLVGYFVGFGLPMIPAIRNEWSFLAKDWHAVVLYCLLCAMGFGYGTSRIRAMLNMKAARRLVARSQEGTSPTPVEVQPLALVPEDQDRTAA